MNKCFVLPGIVYFMIMALSGCSMVKEMGKGVAGVSTQVLEDKRPDALKKSFALSYNDCYAKVREILTKGVSVTKDVSDKGTDLPYIYSEDPSKKMIAIYLSEADTTPVGIFFIALDAANTTVEISSPSVYAKEEIANKIFKGINILLKLTIEEKKIDAEKKSDN